MLHYLLLLLTFNTQIASLILLLPFPLPFRLIQCFINTLLVSYPFLFLPCFLLHSFLLPFFSHRVLGSTKPLTLLCKVSQAVCTTHCQRFISFLLLIISSHLTRTHALCTKQLYGKVRTCCTVCLSQIVYNHLINLE